jgi:hypothetical protein
MIFMSQSGLIAGASDSGWDAWYLEHLRIMATVPGVGSAQRFRSASAGHPPSLAVYTFASADIFQDPYYLRVRGMGDWLPLIDRRYYRRNLFAGLVEAPVVAEGEYLLVSDRDRIEPQLAGIEWTWLECVGIDRSTPYRAIAVADATVAQRARSEAAIAVYAPASPRFGGAPRA